MATPIIVRCLLGTAAGGEGEAPSAGEGVGCTIAPAGVTSRRVSVEIGGAVGATPSIVACRAGVGVGVGGESGDGAPIAVGVGAGGTARTRDPHWRQKVASLGSEALQMWQWICGPPVPSRSSPLIVGGV